MPERLISKSSQIKRVIVARVIGTAGRVQFREQTPGSINTLDKMLREGHRVAGLVPHFSKKDFLAILAGLMINSEELIKRPLLIPTAAHQRLAYLDWVCSFTDIGLATIITRDTLRKEKELAKKGEPIPWEGLDAVAAMDQYLNRAAETLNEGGVVILAPQGGRKNWLLPFHGQPIARLEKWTIEKGLGNLALFSIGLEVVGATDYSKLKGLNLRSKYIVTLGTTTKREAIEGNIDDWGYQDMLRLAPPAYRPQKVQIC